MPRSFLFVAVCILASHGVLADLYMLHPRGSNNKMTEQNNNAQNQDRLFDSQNNAAAGYQIGDNCFPNCKDGNTDYDANKVGAQKGQMKFYQRSELYVEWTAQHGCGSGTGKATECQLVLQYMCNSDAPGLRDGHDPDSNSRRRSGGGDNNNAEDGNEADGNDPARGRHESFLSFNHCRKRQRNKGLYSATRRRNLNKQKGAATTRQNNNADRRGFECAEERDYYPYWHPSEWRDIAVFTTEPEDRCNTYREESQNVKPKGYCDDPRIKTEDEPTIDDEDLQVPNNPIECAKLGHAWVEKPAWEIPAPECLGMPLNRDNHHGSVLSGAPMSYLWLIPDTIPDQDICVLRMRYNMTSGDLVKPPSEKEEDLSPPWDYFFDLDSNYDETPVIKQNPKKDFVGLGKDRSGPLQIQVNTAQFGRTFQDRSHTFMVQKRPANTNYFDKIVNCNVRGRRGNIVQTYPAVEYDFVPPELVISQYDYIHFQWVGADSNANGNAGNGKQGTDRSNLCEVADSTKTGTCRPFAETKLFMDAESADAETLQEVGGTISRFAMLDQAKNGAEGQRRRDNGVRMECPDEETQQDLNDNDNNNCLQLNMATAYFDGGLIQMTEVGEHHIASTRNNDYSNRSHKSVIKISRKLLSNLTSIIVVALSLIALTLAYHTGKATYALVFPTSDLFSKKNRPCLLRCPCLRFKVKQKEAVRQRRKQALQDAWRMKCEDMHTSYLRGSTPVPTTMGAAAAPVSKGNKPSGAENAECTLPPKGGAATPGWIAYMMASMPALDLFIVTFFLAEVIVAVIGFFRNAEGGFNMWFPVAKCGGYILDFNLSLLLIPTLRSIQTGARGSRALDRIFNEDPIAFHIRLAKFVALGITVHVTGHFFHILACSRAAKFPTIHQTNPSQVVAGMNWGEMLFNPSNRFAGATGVIILYLMAPMFLTANTYVRRRTYDMGKRPSSCKDVVGWTLLFMVLCLYAPVVGLMKFWKLLQCKRFKVNMDRKFGGFTVFWQVHKSWLPAYLLLFVHGPNQWIWFLFPTILVLCDRLISFERRSLHTRLKSAEVLKGKVMKLTFALPRNFSYQAGMYIQINVDTVSAEEWHPFTLTSAPEEGHLSVHIRCPDELDWCSDARRKLAEGPAQLIGKGSIDMKKRFKVSYGRFAVPGDDGTFTRPYRVQEIATDGRVEKSFEVNAKDRKGEDAAEMNEVIGARLTKAGSTASLTDLQDARPKDVVRIGIDGPHGTPSEMVWKHRVNVLVGAGIGVTPWASILKSITLRSRRPVDKVSVSSARSKSAGGRWPAKEGNLRKVASGDDSEEEPNAFIPCSRVHFYWLCRSKEEFEWFYDMLCEATRGKNDEIEVNLFQTGETDLSKTESLGNGMRQFFGRPSWGKILPKMADQYPGDSIGVFLCGPGPIREDLRKNCKKANENDKGAKFTLYAENF